MAASTRSSSMPCSRIRDTIRSRARSELSPGLSDSLTGTEAPEAWDLPCPVPGGRKGEDGPGLATGPVPRMRGLLLAGDGPLPKLDRPKRVTVPVANGEEFSGGLRILGQPNPLLGAIVHNG